MVNSKREKVSAFLIVYHEEDVIERALKSLKGAVDQIVVIHDGPCSDSTLDIAKKYTPDIHVVPHKGRASLHMIYAFNACKHDWLFKLDADEFLSDELRNNLNDLSAVKDIDAYTFRWPLWNGVEYATHSWPHKKAMFRKSGISFLQFPGWDEPGTTGRIVETDFLLEHKPSYGMNEAFLPWKKLWQRGIKRGRDQARYTLMDFSEFEQYHYSRDDFPFSLRLRRNYPLLSAPLFALGAFVRGVFSDGAYREGSLVLRGAIETSLFYLWLGYTIYNLKKDNA